MAAFCRDGRFVLAVAEPACTRNVHARRFIIFTGIFFVDRRPVSGCNHCSTNVPSSFGDGFPLPVELPALLHVGPVVSVATPITEAAEASDFIVFAYIGSVVGDGGVTHVGGPLGAKFLVFVIGQGALLRCVVAIGKWILAICLSCGGRGLLRRRVI